eukprot:gene11804-160_t
MSRPAVTRPPHSGRDDVRERRRSGGLQHGDSGGMDGGDDGERQLSLTLPAPPHRGPGQLYTQLYMPSPASAPSPPQMPVDAELPGSSDDARRRGAAWVVGRCPSTRSCLGRRTMPVDAELPGSSDD